MKIIRSFINAELVGTVTNVPWCVKFPSVEGCRHPSQLYASLKDLIIFITLWIIGVKQYAQKSHKWKDGTIFGIFICIYAILRFIVGFTRAPDSQLGYLLFGLTMGQLLNILLLLVGIGFLLFIYRKKIFKQSHAK
jgi:phosphatidylglycerol:prolipoprotein diacylglycerol transferase